MTKEDIGKLKQTIADFGHWYDKIGRVSIIKNEEKVLILEKSIEYIEELEADIQDLEGIKLAQETALSKEYIIEEQLRKDNTELKEKCAKLEQGYVWHDYDAGEDAYEDSHEGRWVTRDEVYKLDKAVLIIKNLLHLWNDVMTEETVKALVAEAEQFLKGV